ncbi:hypothetical protein COO92_07630 [Thalassospira lohafexi]|uniref:Uncharacterized protein n=1 Tax=Thalassospira lohafexi TaxID=744227 RepID=A0A2N3L7L2_9PROT|nr:hypothetical protein COO92_07630 [Thalassospira lohafexi]
MMPQKLMNIFGLLLSFSYIVYGSFFDFSQNILIHLFIITVALMMRFDRLFFVNANPLFLSKKLNSFNWKVSLPCTVFTLILLILAGTDFQIYFPLMFMCILNMRVYLELFLHHRNPEKYT